MNRFIETSPAPVKYAILLLGKREYRLRLPMMPASPTTHAAVRETMVHAGRLID
jgi:4-hydroxy-tetrahydrodipicolinate synthase